MWLTLEPQNQSATGLCPPFVTYQIQIPFLSGPERKGP